MSNLFRGQLVKVTKSQNAFNACDLTVYKIASINKVNGAYDALLTLNGVIAGVIDEKCLKAL